MMGLLGWQFGEGTKTTAISNCNVSVLIWLLCRKAVINEALGDLYMRTRV